MSEKQTEWMYSGTSKPDLEQYLLGRRIDDAVDPNQDTEKAADWISGKVPEDGDIAGRSEMWKTRDAFAKAREDPMFIIEKQKRNAHVDLKNNPLKMQKIKDLLASELKKDLKKKKKKRRKSREEGSPERKEEPMSSSSRNRSDVSERGSDSRSDRKRRISRSPEQSGSRHRSRSPVKHRNRRDKSRSRSRSRDKQVPKPGFGLIVKSSTKPATATEKPATSQNPTSTKPAKSKYPIPRGGSGISKKMSAEEMARKREEMLSNAKGRDVERRERYSKHKDTELEDTAANKEGKAEFLHKFKVDAYSSSSTTVEDRIKSGIFSKQRTKADLGKFLKK